MTDLLLIILFALANGFVAGWYTREWHAKRVVTRFHDAMNQELAKHYCHISISEDQGTYLVHNAKTGEFMAQGRTHSEISDVLNKRFPGMFFTADADDLRKIGYKHDTL